MKRLFGVFSFLLIGLIAITACGVGETTTTTSTTTTVAVNKSYWEDSYSYYYYEYYSVTTNLVDSTVTNFASKSASEYLFSFGESTVTIVHYEGSVLMSSNDYVYLKNDTTKTMIISNSGILYYQAGAASSNDVFNYIETSSDLTLTSTNGGANLRAVSYPLVITTFGLTVE